MVLRTGRMLRLTQQGDFYIGRLAVSQVRFVGSGLTPGDRLVITDINNSLVTEHTVAAVIEDATVLGVGRNQFMNGVRMQTMPGGTTEVEIHLM